jgi:hypothetical protein
MGDPAILVHVDGSTSSSPGTAATCAYPAAAAGNRRETSANTGSTGSGQQAVPRIVGVVGVLVRLDVVQEPLVANRAEQRGERPIRAVSTCAR